jgi:hypothetical protein
MGRRFLVNFSLQLAGGVRGRDSDPRRPKCLSKWAGHQIPRSGELAARNTASVAGDQTVHGRLHVYVDPPEMATPPCTHGYPVFRFQTSANTVFTQLAVAVVAAYSSLHICVILARW